MARLFGGMASVAILVGSTWLAAAEDAKPTVLAPGTTVSSKDAAEVPQGGDKAQTVAKMLAAIKLPPGFHISLYAVVPAARHMAVTGQGKIVFVGTRMSKVYAVAGPQPIATASTESANLAAVASIAAGPLVKEFVGKITKVIPHGVCMAKDGTLYVVEQNRVLAFKDAERFFTGEDIAVSALLQQGEMIPRQYQSFSHSARVCRVGPDDMLYISLGEPANVPPIVKLADYNIWGIGGIARVRRDGKYRDVFARGVRNSVGIDFSPFDKSLWFTDNQVDGLGDDIPPGELNRATKAGQNFGFPWYGGGHTRTNEYKDQTPPPEVVFPMVEEAAHAADLGLTFYTGAAFPEKYRRGIFSAQHGSWNRTTPVGARIMFTPVKSDGTADHSEVFAEGWLTPAGKYLGRPVDVAQLPDGTLLVSDDEVGALYRIIYDGK